MSMSSDLNCDLLYDIVARVVFLVDLPRDCRHELPSVGLTKGKERIALKYILRNNSY